MINNRVNMIFTPYRSRTSFAHIFLFTFVLWGGVLFVPDVRAKAEDADQGSQVLYVSLDPPLITNYQHKRLRYLKAELSVKVSTQETADALTHHMPEVRHKLLLMLSEYDVSTLIDVAKRDAVRERAKQTIKDILEQESTPALIEEVLFVNFIVE